MARLRKYLVEWQSGLCKYVEEGSAPIFGYPPICYTPPNKKEDDLKEKKDNKEYLSVFMSHVFKKSEAIPSVAEIIDAKNSETLRINDL